MRFLLISALLIPNLVSGIENAVVDKINASTSPYRGHDSRRHYGTTPRKAFQRRLSQVQSVEINASGARELQAEDVSVAMEVCESSIPMEEEVGAEFGTTCNCTPDLVARTAILTCSDTKCAYCNAAETVCTGYSYGVVFDSEGVDIEYFEQDEYTVGRTEAIRYSETDEGCQVYVGTEQCNECLLQDCVDGYFGIDVSCDNIDSDAIYNSCQTRSYTGIFEAYNEGEFNDCITNSDLCERDPTSDEDKYDCACETDEAGSGANTLQCADKCEYCNDDLSVCAQEAYERFFDNARFSRSTRTVSYTSGRSEVIILSENECDALGCRSCVVEVDGVTCNQCDMKVCDDGSRAPQFTCDNIEPGTGSVDLCLDRRLDGSVFEYFSAGFADECTSKSELACREAKKQYEESEKKFDCECEPQDDGSLELQCEATCGDLCNEEESVCVRESFFQDFLDEGASSYFRKDIQYTIGRKELLSYVEFTDGICSMTIDGVGCNSCVIRTCNDNPEVDRAPLIDCTDFEGGAVLDLCEPNLRIETGIFERFSVEEFQECLDRTPANSVCQVSENVASFPFSTSGTTLLIPYDESISCGKESFAPGLWYKVVGTGQGLEASLCETESDFMSQISVYTGSCGGLECFEASNQDCKTSWFGEVGQEYFVRVHGVGGQTGTFGLTIDEVNFAARECEAQKEILERDPALAKKCGTCTLAEDSTTATLECETTCAICDQTGEVCAGKNETLTFGVNGDITETVDDYQFTMGRSDALVISKTQCRGADDCRRCNVQIDGVNDAVCTVVNCESDPETEGIEASWGEFIINSCKPETLASNDVFQVLADPTFQTCFSRDPTAACMETRDYEQSLDSSVSCECDESSEDGNQRLVCQKRSCLRCNEERTNCGYSAYGYIFGKEFGRLIRRFDGFQYVEGRSDLVAYHSYNEMAMEDSCMVTVGNDECATCQPVECGPEEGRSLFHGKTFDCQEVGGLFYNGCSLIDLPGVFSFINDPSYETCIPVENPAEVCERYKQVNLATDSPLSNSCECVPNERRGYDLVCKDADDCQFCTDQTQTLCADYAEYRAEINQYGSYLYHADTFAYTAGRSETLVIKDNEAECEVSINGEICTACSYAQCEDTTLDDIMTYDIDCSNVMGEPATFQCGEGHEVFATLSSGTKHYCESDTKSPTVSPTDGPTSSPTTEAPTVEATAAPSTPASPSGSSSSFNFGALSVSVVLSSLALLLL